MLEEIIHSPFNYYVGWMADRRLAAQRPANLYFSEIIGN